MESIANSFSAEDLSERGIAVFIEELRHSSPQRRDQLTQFLAACRPTAAAGYHREWDVRIAKLADLAREGRVAATIPHSNEALSIDGASIEDTDLHLIDLSGGVLFSNQTALVPHAWLIVEEIRHMNYHWLEKGLFDPRTGPTNLTNLHPAHRTGRISLTSSPLRLPDSSVYFLFHGLIGTTSFGHFLFDILGQLIFYDKLKQEYGKKLVPVITAPSWFTFKWPGMKWLFEELVGREADILFFEGDCRANLVRGFTTNRVVSRQLGLSFAAIRYARDRIRSTVTMSPAFLPSKRIYISRKDAGDREVNNIDAVERLLEDFQFKTILIEHITPQQAYDELSGAEVIVGMHGSGLMYHFYARSGAIVIELEHPVTPWNIIRETALGGVDGLTQA